MMSAETKDLSRKNHLEQMVPAEKAIFDAIQAVGSMPADVRLTDALCLLAQARDKVSDFIDYRGDGGRQ